jgi:hypothetical protein
VVAFAFVATVLSAAGHLAAGGCAPQLGVLLASSVLPWTIAAAMAHRRRSLITVMTSLAGVQLALHLIFAVTSGVSLGAVFTGSMFADFGLSLPMVGVHLVALAFTGVILHQADAALDAVDGWVERRVRRWLSRDQVVAWTPGQTVVASSGTSAVASDVFPTWWGRGPPR